MLTTQRVETEVMGDFYLVTNVFRNECPVCSCSVVVSMPVLPGEELAKMLSE